MEDLLSVEEIKRVKSINNHVFVDIGDTDGTNRNYHIEELGMTLKIDTSYGGFNYLKRSGKVLSVPNKLHFNKPYALKEKIDNVIINTDDIVFFEPETKSQCEHKKLVFKTKNDTTIYAITYNNIICALDAKTRELKMINGKVLVKRKHELNTAKIDAIFEVRKEHDMFVRNWVEITEANNDEGYSGVYLAVSKFAFMNYRREYLKKGNLILIKKMGSFDIQSALKDNTSVEALQDTFTVSRHNVIAVKDNENSTPKAFGLYAQVKVDKKDTNTNILTKHKRIFADRQTGTVISVGGGIDTCTRGDKILFNNKHGELIEGYAYVHNRWILGKSY